MTEQQFRDAAHVKSGGDFKNTDRMVRAVHSWQTVGGKSRSHPECWERVGDGPQGAQGAHR